MASGSPELARASIATSAARIEVTPEDIRFRNIAPGRVRITVTVHNRGGSWSAATTMRVEAAPLGAFVATRPLTTLKVPAIPPLRCVNVSAEVEETPVEALSGSQPPRHTPRVGSSMDDDELWADRREFLLAQRSLRQVTRNRGGDGRLPGDILKLGNLGSLHWAGNLNVFVGSREVERHQATQLRISPGVCNSTWWCIGNGTRDRYRVSIEIEDHWQHELLGFAEGDWTDTACGSAVLLFTPPKAARHGVLNVHVEQASTGKTALVEFGFDTDAAGPGCYTL